MSTDMGYFRADTDECTVADWPIRGGYNTNAIK